MQPEVTATASMLYAQSQGTKCDGPYPCHWCGSPCHPLWRHNEPPPTPFIKSPVSSSKCPGSPYVCIGCYLFLRPSVTVPFLHGTFRDRQTAPKHSWWITSTSAHAIRLEKDAGALLRLLFAPPRSFALLLNDGTVSTHLHLGINNDPGGIIGGTNLHFTFNNVRYAYSVFELGKALEDKQGNGKSAGVQILLRYFRDHLNGIDLETYYPRQRTYEGVEVGSIKGKRGNAVGNRDREFNPKTVILASGSR